MAMIGEDARAVIRFQIANRQTLSDDFWKHEVKRKALILTLIFRRSKVRVGPVMTPISG